MRQVGEVSVLLLGCVCFVGGNQIEHTSPGLVASGLRLSVRVYDGVNVSPSELTAAEHDAAMVFEAAGIQLVWEHGLSPGRANHPAGEHPNRAAVHLRIWTRAMAGKRHSGIGILGFCLSLESGEAVVLADAIPKRPALGTTSFADHLGLAMAHELGHLLLHSATHSAAGIMRARWGTKDLAEADRGYLRFTAAEGASIRDEIRRRMNLKSALSQ